MPVTAANPPTAPTLPTAFVSAVPPDALGGSNPTCTALDDLQTKCNALAYNDTLSIEANHAFVSPFDGLELSGPATGSGAAVAPTRNSDTGWIALRSTAEASLLAAGATPGVRVTPATQSVFMPKILTAMGDKAAIVIRDPGRGFRFVGIEIANNPAWYQSFGGAQYANTLLLAWGQTGNGFNHPSLAEMGRRYIFERCYVHGVGEANIKQFAGFSFHGADLRLADCWVDGYTGDNGTECKAFWWLNGTGPALIENNYLVAVTQSFLSGGSLLFDPATYFPSDLIFRRNLCEKLLKWTGWNPFGVAEPTFMAPSSGTWGVKTTFEFKIMKRALVEGNHFHRSMLWPAITYDTVDFQNGLGVHNVEDVTTQHNLITDSMSAFQCWVPSGDMRRMRFHNNLGIGIRYGWIGNSVTPSLGTGASGKFLVDSGRILDDMALAHNTFLGDRAGLYFENLTALRLHRFSAKNNIHGFGRGGLAISPNATQGDHFAGDTGFDAIAQDWELADAFVNGRNVYDAGYSGGPAPLNPAQYPFPYANAYWGPTNFAAGEFLKPGDPATAGINEDTGVLSAGPLKNAATDGKDLGVDFALLNAALAGGDATTMRPPVTMRPAATVRPPTTMRPGSV